MGSRFRFAVILSAAWPLHANGHGLGMEVARGLLQYTVGLAGFVCCIAPFVQSTDQWKL